MTSEAAAGLRTLAEALPAGAAVPVPREWLLELLGSASAAPAPPATSITPADLTVAELATRFGRRPSTVRGWLDRKLIPGAYRFQRREWRVPAAAVAAFEAQQRSDGVPATIAAPRSAGRRPVDLGAWRSASYTGPRRRQAP